MKLLKLSLIPIILIFLCGCATVPMTSSPPKEPLKRSVKKMMQAKVDGRWDLVYDYFDQGYKKKVSRQQFSGIPRSMFFHSFTIDSFELDPSGQKAVVKLTSTFSARGFRFDEVESVQNWKIENGQWVLIMKDANPFIDK